MNIIPNAAHEHIGANPSGCTSQVNSPEPSAAMPNALFQPDWVQSDRPGLEALLHQLNAGAERPPRLEQLQIVLIAAGWV